MGEKNSSKSVESQKASEFPIGGKTGISNKDSAETTHNIQYQTTRKKFEQNLSSVDMKNEPVKVEFNAMNENMEEYFGFPLTSQINKQIQTELNERGRKRTWQNEVTSFIRVIPGVYYENEEKSRLIFRSVKTDISNLHTENFSFEQLYSPDMSFRPVAGITGLTVDYKNAWGSIRKATLKWRVSSLWDLQEIMPFIGTPGRHVLIEWGWSPYADEFLKSEEDILKSGFTKENQFMENLTRVLNSRGNFDSLLGIITNYEFTLQKDGSFEGTTDVTTGGFLMEGMDMNKDFVITSYDPINKKIDTKDGDKSADAIVMETLKMAAKNGAITKMISEHSKDARFSQIYMPTNKFNKIGYNDRFIKNFGGEPGEDMKAEGTRKFLYVSWGYIEDFIINPYTCKLRDSDGRRLMAFDSSFSKISSNMEALRSLKPDVCFIPLSNAKKLGEAKEKEILTTDSQGNKITVKVKTYDFSAATGKVPFFTKGKDNDCSIQYSSPRLIFVNVDHLMKCIEKGSKLMDFVYDLFKDINDSVGGTYWQFQIRELEGAQIFRDEYEKSENKEKMPKVVYSIIDLEFFDKKYEEIKDKTYMFNLMSVETKDTDNNNIVMNSIVKNINFNSKLSSEMALSAYYALNTDKVDYEVGTDMGLMYSLFAPEGKKIIDSFLPDVTPVEDIKKTSTGDGEVKNKEYEELKNKYEDGLKSIPDGLREYLPYEGSQYFPWLGISEEKQKETYDKLITSEQIMRVALLNYKNQSDPGNQGIIPVTIEIELDGISGLKIGDIFSLDYVPDMYRRRSVFQISNLSHDLSNNSWVTKIKAIIRVFTTNITSKVANDKARDRSKPAPAIDRISPARNDTAELKDETLKDNWKLVIDLLETIKSDLGVSYEVTSGYRKFTPNGGSPNSLHRKGLAADVVFRDVRGDFSYGVESKMYKIWKEIKKRYKSRMIECFYENNGSTWIHIAHIAGKQYKTNKTGVAGKIDPRISGTRTIRDKDYETWTV